MSCQWIHCQIWILKTRHLSQPHTDLLPKLIITTLHLLVDGFYQVSVCRSFVTHSLLSHISPELHLSFWSSLGSICHWSYCSHFGRHLVLFVIEITCIWMDLWSFWSSLGCHVYIIIRICACAFHGRIEFMKGQNSGLRTVGWSFDYMEKRLLF